jgi:hypothetical protein
VKLTSAETFPTGSNDAVPWDAADIDELGAWAASPNPTRLTVPAGVSRVRLQANVTWTTNTTGYRRMYLQKNGAAFPGEFLVDSANHGSSTPINQNASTPALEVSSGDYFELFVQQISGGNLDMQDSDTTWLAMEAVK